MAFYNSLARDPKTDDEFWKIIEETFEQVEPTLTAYPVETREQALEPRDTSQATWFAIVARPRTTSAATTS